MTYTDFEKEINKLGLKFCVSDDLICVQDENRNALYSVDTTKPYVVYYTLKFLNLDDTMQEKIFELVYLLARTSIKNRGELHK